MSSLQNSNQMKKAAQTIHYGLNWNQQLNFHMGWHAYFIVNGRFYRAFWQLYSAILQVQKDKRQRLFVVDRKKQTPDAELRAEFDALADKFNALFGTGPPLDGKLSYLQLKATEQPKPEDGRVFISAMVRVVDAWAEYQTQYLNLKIGFAYPIQQGFQTHHIPMFDFNSKEIHTTMTNCIPYPLWQEQSVKCLNLLMPVAKEIETTIAAYLHREGVNPLSTDELAEIPMDAEGGDDFETGE